MKELEPKDFERLDIKFAPDIPPYKQDIIKGEIVYYWQNELGERFRPICFKNDKITLMSVGLIKERQKKILQREDAGTKMEIFDPHARRGGFHQK